MWLGGDSTENSPGCIPKAQYPQDHGVEELSIIRLLGVQYEEGVAGGVAEHNDSRPSSGKTRAAVALELQETHNQRKCRPTQEASNSMSLSPKNLKPTEPGI